MTFITMRMGAIGAFVMQLSCVSSFPACPRSHKRWTLIRPAMPSGIGNLPKCSEPLIFQWCRVGSDWQLPVSLPNWAQPQIPSFWKAMEFPKQEGKLTHVLSSFVNRRSKGVD